MRRIWKDESPLPTIETLLLRGAAALAVTLAIVSPSDLWPARGFFAVVGFLLLLISIED